MYTNFWYFRSLSLQIWEQCSSLLPCFVHYLFFFFFQKQAGQARDWLCGCIYSLASTMRPPRQLLSPAVPSKAKHSNAATQSITNSASGRAMIPRLCSSSPFLLLLSIPTAAQLSWDPLIDGETAVFHPAPSDTPEISY